MAKIELHCANREITGKQVKVLRRNNITPVHLYGSGIKSSALQCDTVALEKVLPRVRDTGLITLKTADDKKTKSVIVREVQRDGVSGKLLHVDFFQVDMTEKLEVQVPIVLVGVAPVLDMKGTSIAHEINTLAIECLPENIPSKIEVDISSLSVQGSVLRIKDISVSPDITLLGDPEQAVLTVITRVEEKAVPKEKPQANPAG